MKNITVIKRGLLKKVLVIMGVCSAGLMASCAKYGTPVLKMIMNLKGTVRSKSSSQTIEGIQVELGSSLPNPKALTNNNGYFNLKSEINEYDNSVLLRISDIDGALNGSFLSKDTILILSSDEKQSQLKENIEIKLG